MNNEENFERIYSELLNEDFTELEELRTKVKKYKKRTTRLIWLYIVSVLVVCIVLYAISLDLQTVLAFAKILTFIGVIWLVFLTSPLGKNVLTDVDYNFEFKSKVIKKL